MRRAGVYGVTRRRTVHTTRWGPESPGEHTRGTAPPAPVGPSPGGSRPSCLRLAGLVAISEAPSQQAQGAEEAGAGGGNEDGGGGSPPTDELATAHCARNAVTR